MAATLNTNSRVRKDKAHKAGKCQLCGDNTSGYSVILAEGTVKRVKARAGHAFYCKPDADRKVKIRQARLDNADAPAKPRKAKAATTKAAPAKRVRKAKAAKAEAAKPKRVRKPKAAAKPARKRTVAGKAKQAAAKPKRVRKAKAATGTDPF